MSSISVTNLTNTGAQGTFDLLAKAVLAQLQAEFAANRITASEYSKVLVTTLDSILGQSIQFELQREISNQQAQLLEAQRFVAVAQEQSIQKDILLTIANTSKVTREVELLDKQEDLLDAQILLTVANKDKVVAENDLLVVEKDKTTQEVLLVTAQKDAANKNIEVLSAQLLNIPKEGLLLDKQVLKTVEETTFLSQRIKTEKAQISDTVDSVAVTGVLGKQMTLYTIQSDGFKRDAEYKLVSKMIDSWTVRRTTDDATIVDGVNKLNDANIGAVVSKAMVGIGVTPL